MEYSMGDLRVIGEALEHYRAALVFNKKALHATSDEIAVASRDIDIIDRLLG